MKLSTIINYPLSLLGLKIAKISSINQHRSLSSTADIELDVTFMRLYYKVLPFTMVSIERCYSLYKSVRYIVSTNTPGDFIECGVWKGGSSMLMALTLLDMGIVNRKIVLFDTFEGMVEPGENDSEFEKNQWKRLKNEKGGSDWCHAPLDEVRQNMLATTYPPCYMEFVPGRIEHTIPRTQPPIALLRLDTDWYGSTFHELTHFYPLVVPGGVLIIDDYGSWEGARRATDDYFKDKQVFMQRIDHTGRLIVKY